MSFDAGFLVLLEAVALAAMAHAFSKGRARPGGWVLQLGPFLLFAALALRIGAHWESIPDRIPLHFRFGGEPDRWTDKSYGTVFGFLGLGAVVCLLQAGFGFLSLKAKLGPVENQVPPEVIFRARGKIASIFLGAEYLVAVIFSLSVLSITGAKPFPEVAAAVATAIFFVWVGVALVLLTGDMKRMHVEGANGEPEDVWKYGVFYVNPENPRLIVPKRYGLGYTLNFAKPTAWITLLLLLILPIALLVYLRPR